MKVQNHFSFGCYHHILSTFNEILLISAIGTASVIVFQVFAYALLPKLLRLRPACARFLLRSILSLNQIVMQRLTRNNFFLNHTLSWLLLPKLFDCIVGPKRHCIFVIVFHVCFMHLCVDSITNRSQVREI